MVTGVVAVTTLCPCSKAISSRTLTTSAAGSSIRFVSGMIQFGSRALIELVENSTSCGLYSLLKHPDEKL